MLETAAVCTLRGKVAPTITFVVLSGPKVNSSERYEPSRSVVGKVFFVSRILISRTAEIQSVARQTYFQSTGKTRRRRLLFPAKTRIEVRLSAAKSLHVSG